MNITLQNQKVFFVADTHFSHFNILKYDNRPFNDIHHHDMALINNWNSVVNSDDLVFHLGDVSWGDENVIYKQVSALNGRKILITGNHDSKLTKSTKCSALFEMITPALDLYVKDGKHHQLICLFHYPIHEWNQCHRGSWMLHGHSHGRDTYDKTYKILNVGINLWDYKPISYEQVKIVMAGKDLKLHH